jgi:tripartite-type tricarboxylate transporter receptor subunit TctC
VLLHISRFVAGTIILGYLVVAPNEAQAQAYPTRPIRLVIPYPPGGPTDILGRAVANRLGEVLGQQIVVENRAGVSAILGTEFVAKAAPDGYTLLLADINHAVNPGLYKSLPYDSRKDFTPIGLIASASLALVVNASIPARSAQELIALAKSRPGKLAYGSAGAGNLTHLAPELLKAKYGLDVLHVPYKGAGQALTDLVAGQTSFVIMGLSATKAFIDSGKLRALAITGDKRARSMPDLPTFAEAGVPLPEMKVGSWWGLAGPARLPREIVVKLNRSLAQTLLAPEVRARLEALNIDAMQSSPEEFASWLNAQADTWAEVVRLARITLE